MKHCSFLVVFSKSLLFDLVKIGAMAGIKKDSKKLSLIILYIYFPGYLRMMLLVIVV